MKLRLRKKENTEWAVGFILVMPFLFFGLMNVLHLPSLIKYLVDVAWLFLLFSLLKRRKVYMDNVVMKLAEWTIAFFVVALLGTITHLQSPLYFLWGLRNNLRFFVFFFSCITYVHSSSIPHYLVLFDKIFWINLFVVLIQYFLLGYDGDFLGGIFGVEKGCNGYMNIFMLIVVTKSVLNYMNKKENLTNCILTVAASLLVAILSELKVFVVELVIIILMAAALTKFSLRKLGICVVCIIGVVISGQAIAILFPSFTDWFSIKGIWKIISNTSGYTLRNDFNRANAVSRALRYFLPSLWDKLFGLGLGNCDYASFDFLITPFYRKYSWTNYMWFSSSFITLETGLCGLGVYLLFFAMLYWGINKRQKKATTELLYCQMAKIMVVMCFIIIIYNASLRSEAAYMMYFVLALPFVENKCTHRN